MDGRFSIWAHTMKRYWPMLLIAIGIFVSSGCASLPTINNQALFDGSGKDATGVADSAKQATATSLPSETAESAEEAVMITLGDEITVNGWGATVDGRAVWITAGGTYNISGTLNDGQIIVDTKDKKTVNLVLNGAAITSTSSAPIYIMRGNATEISLADDTENHIADGNYYIIKDQEANEPDAAIFSKGDLTFNGNGSLTVEANYRNAINSKDKLNITGGNITVNAKNDGIRGRDSITIKNGNITVNAKADGMQSNNDKDPERGFISIEGGTINITAGEDGIQAATNVIIKGGTITVSSGGGSANSSRIDNGGNTHEDLDAPKRSADGDPSVNAKGIKAVSGIRIEGGTIRVDSSDDAIHSNANLTINNGNIVLAVGNNGIRSDAALIINGGDISIIKSYEGIEGAVIAINGGSIRLAASKNGLNVASNQANSAIDKHLTVDGGYLVIDTTATGDGIDVDGWAKMTGGTVIVNGPTVDFNGALDYDREFTMAGGTLVAVGSSGMAQAPDTTSTQYCLAPNLGSPQPAGTLVRIEAEDGTGILTFAPKREYQSVIYSSPDLKKGSTYNVYIGGSSTGSVVDGVYSGGIYTPGTRSGSFTISNVVTR